MPTSPKVHSKSDFEKRVPELTKKLAIALERELKDCRGDPTTDLWDLPTVDSKTVCKLSPTVQSILGRRLEPSWVRKGGYDSVEEAVKDIVAQARKHCVPALKAVPAKSIKPVVA
jgi:hypothetical protein